MPRPPPRWVRPLSAPSPTRPSPPPYSSPTARRGQNSPTAVHRTSRRPHVAAYFHELTPLPENTPSTPSPPQTHDPPYNGTPPPLNTPNQSTNPPRSTSLLPVGSTLSFVSVTFTPTVLSPATTTTNVLAYIQSSTVVTATAETVYAVPINGYNIVAAAADPEGSPDSRSSSTPTGAGGSANNSTSTTPTSPGTIAGAVVGGLVALALAVALAYFVGRRRSSNRRRSRILLGDGDGDKARAVVELAGGGVAPAEVSQQQRRGWDDDKDSTPYRYGAQAHELPSQSQRYEMPVQGQRYELHGGGGRGGGEGGGAGGWVL